MSTMTLRLQLAGQSDESGHARGARDVVLNGSYISTKKSLPCIMNTAECILMKSLAEIQKNCLLCKKTQLCIMD
mgnify:CR=1 FL=1